MDLEPRGRHRLRLAAALRRVNRQLAAWDLLDALELLPTSLRPPSSSRG